LKIIFQLRGFKFGLVFIASPKESSSNEIAFQKLIHEINDDLVVHKKVFRMTQLLEKYKAYLPADTGTYSVL
jgi:hypothetical protein